LAFFVSPDLSLPANDTPTLTEPLILKGYITPTEAAKRLDRSRSWIFHLMLNRRLDVLRTPLGRLVSEESVANFKHRRCGRSSAGPSPVAGPDDHDETDGVSF
jgi:hypothetical protein